MERRRDGGRATCRRSRRRSAASSTGSRTTWRCRTSKRAPAARGIWLLANLRDALLLTTSNRSEAAVGYATMDGDTCGGLAPIAGIDKAFLLDWLKWMETTGPAGIGPLPELVGRHVVCDRPQSCAHPRPIRPTKPTSCRIACSMRSSGRRSATSSCRSRCSQTVRPQFPEYDAAADWPQWVERFFRLWCRNQWKRERYAPSFHLDDENLDPKTWCRFPILNSGFERELEELREYVRFGGGTELNRKRRYRRAQGSRLLEYFFQRAVELAPAAANVFLVAVLKLFDARLFARVVKAVISFPRPATAAKTYAT